MVTCLAELAIGQCGRVLAVDASGESGQRILEMGLTPGVSFRVVGVAPLGDPIIFEVRGYRLSLRRIEAALVEVERTGT
jgi:ferrous iron transport protein A